MQSDDHDQSGSIAPIAPIAPITDCYQLALDAAAAAGAIIREHATRATTERQIEFKGPIDLVTATDRAAEAAILDLLRRAVPSHSILAEEAGALDGDRNGRAEPRYQWLIDPLDGTTNFAHGYPVVSVSIALRRDGETVLGVVYDPLRNECFAAQKGDGATLNGDPIHVSTISDLQASLVGTGFPYDKYTSARNNLANVDRVVPRVQGLRRGGSSALDSCYVAAGRLDGFWELKLKPWDMAAGALIVIEAGGRVTGLAGRAFDPFAPEIVATNGRLHDALCALLE